MVKSSFGWGVFIQGTNHALECFLDPEDCTDIEWANRRYPPYRGRLEFAEVCGCGDDHRLQQCTPPRCEATTWKYGTAPGEFGPGGFNRCEKAAGHDGAHRDEWGLEFRLDPWRRVASST